MKRQTFISGMWAATLFAALTIGCASDKHVAVANMSAAARTTTERVTAGGHIEQITRERERGKLVYDVEATTDGKHQEFLIADATGEILGTENSIEFSQLSPAVRESARRYFGTTEGLTAMKGIEYGVVYYEIEGSIGRKRV